MTFASRTVFFFPVNTVAASCNGTASSAVVLRKGVTRARCHFITHPFISVAIFPSILLFSVQLSYNWQQFKTLVIFLGVYRRVYPRHTSKKVIIICEFVTFSLKLGWNIEVCIANNLSELLR